MSAFTRRSFIGKTAVAIGSFAALQKVVGADHPSDPGPANPALDGQNPDSIWPPGTDSKSLVQNFKYPFSYANKRVYEGGWSREVTVRELPVSKTLAGVNMRLTAGGVRELHWHTAGEWAIMLYGTARITAIDRGRQEFCCRCEEKRSLVFSQRHPAFDSGPQSRRLRIHARIRRR